MDQFTGVLEVRLPPQIKSINEPPITVDAADVSADDLFAVAAAFCKQLQITLHSSYIKKVKSVPVSWHADVSCPVAIESGEKDLKVVVVKKEAIVELIFKLQSDQDLEKLAEKDGKVLRPMSNRVDGVPVNFRGIPTQIKTAADFSKFLNFKPEAIHKAMVNTYKKQSLEGEEFTLSRANGRVILALNLSPILKTKDNLCGHVYLNKNTTRPFQCLVTLSLCLYGLPRRRLR